MRILSTKFHVLGIFLAFLPLAPPAVASLLVVSGDSNIENNDTWLSNILGDGTTVKVQDGVGTNSSRLINNYYDSLPGVSSTLVLPGDTIVDDALLAGVDLYLSMLPSDEFTAAELSALQAYLSGGSSLFFLGDQRALADQNSRINDALLALGSSMSIVDSVTAQVGTTSNIDPDPLNSGVTSFTYSNGSLVSLGSGGTSLIRTPVNAPFNENETFIAYETVTADVPEPTHDFGFDGARHGRIWIPPAQAGYGVTLLDVQLRTPLRFSLCMYEDCHL